MERTSLARSAAPGPTKPGVRAVVLYVLDPGPDEHAVDVGAGTGAVSIELARRAGRVTAVERNADRVAAIEENAAASGVQAAIDVRHATAPAGLPEEADLVFIGGTQKLAAILDWVAMTAPRRVVLTAARLETAVDARSAFETRGFDPTLRRIQIDEGVELAGGTAIEPGRPVYLIAGSPGGEAA